MGSGLETVHFLPCNLGSLWLPSCTVNPPQAQKVRKSAIKCTLADEGDHLTLLTIYNGWIGANFSNPWCYEIFIQARNMRLAQNVMKQLLGIMDRYVFFLLKL